MAKRITYGWFLLVFGTGLLLNFSACKHDPIYGEDGITPIDTTDNPVDTTDNPVDTTDNPVDTTNSGTPCDPEVVYFDQDILPILRSNCAFGGCHDDNSAQDGVILTSYDNVMLTADVDPYDLSGSDLYEVITDSDPDDRMPPAPNERLTSAQISKISEWILQGAKNEQCDPDAGQCDTEEVSFAEQVQPVITTNCLGCHNDSAPSAGISLEGYENVKAVADNGLLYGVISWSAGYTPMPFGASEPLPQCTVDQIKSWIDAGAPNN
ncbi:MAG TPA: c-type cytochrome domain-containing protein [Phaeodactylibacter sp.]|nr:c-type cytochrome domain-containing protein [Phaeodactylibacter sp.]